MSTCIMNVKKPALHGIMHAKTLVKKLQKYSM
jgi:hypothetical protein